MARNLLSGAALLALALLSAGPAAAQSKPKAAAKTAAGAPTPAVLAQGKKVYTQYCLTCHQADGGGVQNMNPPLSQTPYVLGDKARLSGIILHGFSENVAIKGETYTNIMPAHDFLTDAQIASLLTYVRNAFGNKASAVSVADVKAVRAAGKK